MALTAAFDKTAYSPGDTVTLTVTSDKRVTSTSVDVAAGGEDVKATLTVITGVTVTDPARSWVLKSDDGKTAVYTSKA